MPRRRETIVESVVADVPTSSDAVDAVLTTEPITESTTIDEKKDGFEIGAAPNADPVDDSKGKPKKGARKPKPCVRCDERRKREREYARASRIRAKLSKAPVSTPASDLTASGDAPATVMESS